MNWQAITDKIFELKPLSQKIEALRSDGKKVVFTNGCFDLIHQGHLEYLCSASELGDFLVIGLNADESVRRLKGAHRPIKDEWTRASLLAALAFVDAVIIFTEDTPLNLITTLKPDVLCKGGDWAIDQIIGADIVLKNGGLVKSIPFLPGHSTTSLEQKIKSYTD